MAAPTANELGAFTGREVNEGQAEAVISTVSAMASAYTRGRGFTDGEPNNDVRAVILAASARLIADSSQVTTAESMGPFSISRTPFDGWSTAELYVLNRYRERAR
ncbi:hypothetical protein A5755_29695 [Mycolicibacterium fortuitum]|nr:hypothetical protein A5763_10415 [Mycolicibacterium fortuitum]OBB47476.1 hypothetical protein A5754_06625 [Mycolicibacterium fortuitum]OBB54951.1 hypothetical protein A5755_29695 [Mycolicibacterium fortuitum]OBF85537.1 hypothetical protein A5751_09940 [Mycolicibacterium fortuitum]OBG26122.1 hypothetical protein A5768_17365 [Mycolicibacterium fortuitum]